MFSQSGCYTFTSSGWHDLFLGPSRRECNVVGAGKIPPLHWQMHVVVSDATESVHPASAGIDVSARDDERSVADATLEGMVPPFPRPASWHNQARPADVPVVSRFL